MQQTQTYQLNLIEKTDAFSPDPLNENMEKVEGAINAVAAHADGLDQRLQVFEARHVAFGSYHPGASRIEISLGFRPRAVVTLCGYGFGRILLDQHPTGEAGITSGGFYVDPATENGILTRSASYDYIAFD